jgi:hypothetical protein
MNQRRLLCGWAALAAVLWGSVEELPAEVRLSGPHLQDGSGVEIAVTALFDQVPQIGFLPVRVWIRNDSGAERQWSMTANSGENFYRGNLATRSQWSFSVDAGAQREFEVALPLSRASGFHQTSRLDLRFQGYGVEEGSLFFGSTYYSNGPATEFTGLSRSLHVADWNKLEEFCKGSTRSLCGTSLDAAFLPGSWQAYAGMGTMWMLEAEWAGLPALQRGAIEEWVATGGRLFLLRGVQSPDYKREIRNHGLGSICHLALEPSGALRPSLVFEEITKDADNRHRRISGQYEGKWDLKEAVGKQELNAAFVILFMLVFAVLAGPVNLFVFAKGRRRHFLFWTTPVLSVVASILLLGVILVQDGTGGKGVRRQLAVLLPEVRQEVVIQEQISKTGLLLDRRFTSAGPWWIQPLDLRNNGSSNFNASYQQDGLRRSGDFFRNRSVQGQLLVDVRPSRARLEFLQEGGVPKVVNGLSGEIETLWLRDAKGGVWTAEAVGSGEKKELKAAESFEMQEFREKEMDRTVGWQRYAWGRLPQDDPGVFFALMKTGSLGMMETLSDIRWEPGSVLVAGTWEGYERTAVLEQATPEAVEESP